MSMTADQRTLARLYLADQGTSAVQSIQIDNAIGGTFTITFNGQTTAALAYNAQASDVQNALAALSTIGIGNVSVVENAGVPNAVFFAIYFTGTLGESAQNVVTVNSSLTGTGVVVTVSQVTAGGAQAFTDAELDSLYDQAKTNFFLSVCYAFRVLQSSAAKFNKYVAGQSQEEKQQIYDHLESLAQLYQQWAQADRQVQFATLMGVPPRVIAWPVMPGVPAVGMAIGPRGVGPWWKWRRNGIIDGWGNT